MLEVPDGKLEELLCGQLIGSKLPGRRVDTRTAPALFWFRLSRSNDAASGFSTLSQGAGQRSEVSFWTLALPHFQNTGDAGFSLVGIKPEPGPPFSHT